MIGPGAPPHPTPRARGRVRAPILYFSHTKREYLHMICSHIGIAFAAGGVGGGARTGRVRDARDKQARYSGASGLYAWTDGGDWRKRNPELKLGLEGETMPGRRNEAGNASNWRVACSVAGLLAVLSLSSAGAQSVGSKWRDCEQCPEMVAVPRGSFEMGASADEKVRRGNEGPVRRVTIAEPFAVGVYEVTFDEWDACARAGGCRGRPDDRGWGRATRPVINVSWKDAKVYVGWLSSVTGKEYRLLSEAEWEYVARAGTRGPFHFDGAMSPARANYAVLESYRRKTVAVGSFPGNGFGLHDVHGNAWEWVEDCWHADYKGAPSDGSAWTTDGDCSVRVLRGGSWSNGPGVLRSASRFKYPLELRSGDFGLRVARSLAPR